MISKLLSAAIRLYLRSQVSQAEDLQVKIIGKNQQILRGYIPQVWLSCDRAVYQGLYLSQVELNGTNIAINLPEIVKKEPLKLLEPVFVSIELKLDASDLQASLNSELLQSGLDDLWQMIVKSQSSLDNLELWDFNIEWHKIAIADNQLYLEGTHQNSTVETKELCLSTKLSLVNQHTLSLSDLQITNQSLFINQFQQELEIDLGTDIAIAKLIIESEQILCTGKIRINN
ncbi:MAG: DUF2993 domain-containing protein [Cyanobacteria bacterium P01_A01_bin.83]